MFKALLSFPEFLHIFKLIKMCEHSHHLGESMHLHDIKKLKCVLGTSVQLQENIYGVSCADTKKIYTTI